MKKRIQKQIGCMDGLFLVFDRQMFFARKRVHSVTKRRSSSLAPDSTSQSGKSPEVCSELERKEKVGVQNSKGVVSEIDGVKCSWKLRESPRLSLDSRAIADGKGSLNPRQIRMKEYDAAEEEEDKQRDSPSLVARLMGLETLPETRIVAFKEPKLRRTCSEPNFTRLLDYKSPRTAVESPRKKSGQNRNQQALIPVAKAPSAPLPARCGKPSTRSNHRFKAAIPQNKTDSCNTVVPVRRGRSNSGSKSRMANSTKTLPSPATSSQLQFPSKRRPLINNRRSSTEICLSSSVSRNHKRLETKDYRHVKNLLTRCDELVNSIAGITTMSYNGDNSPLKPCIDLEDQSTELEGAYRSRRPNDDDFAYITKILQASNNVSGDSDFFSLLEKQCYKSDLSEVSRLHRRLVFDTITEILDNTKGFEPRKAASMMPKPSFNQIWLQFLTLQEPPFDEDLFDQFICRVLGKDLANETINNGWRDCREERGDMVLDIEKMIFKDLVGEMIKDLATSRRNHRFVAYQVQI